MIEYPLTPHSKPRMTQRDKWKGRPVVLSYFAFRDAVRALNVELPIPCKVTFYVPMPSSWSAKKRLAMLGEPHQSKPDIDNFLKGLLDAVFEDDSAVWSIWAEKRWRDTPGIYVEAL